MKVIALNAFYKTLNQDPAPASYEAGHFNLFRIEDMDLPEHKKVTYSRRDFFKISLVRGHSKIHYADQSIEVRDSALVFTNPMVPYHWERISKKQRGYVCIFTEAFFNRFGAIRDYPVFQSADTAVIPLSATDLPRFEDLFSKMFRELQGNYTYKYELLRHMVMEVVHEAQKMQPATGNAVAGSNASERITGLFAELLERQFPVELSSQVIRLHTPSAFAQQLNVHVNHLNKALKEITGKTTTLLIKERVWQEAKVLLKSTSWTISEIAWCLGFEEPNHFSAFFKSLAGITPNKFRQLGTD
ncbi:helix-turn-helix domain-containing protein [Taibaiella koreensis]|uniref:helix-turn-helix domain-containing protein n=1 Tax=Taibaiella koreensis TaxID=1268548 RepID=UPI000E59B820|nr:AraC family transcriptional regulator [Taibaiella koreensis]